MGYRMLHGNEILTWCCASDTLSRYEEIKKTMFKHKGIEVASQFIFKKHIFLDGERDIVDDVEANLLCFQAHHDIITGTMPVTVDEACYFAAAQLQFELGDYNPFKDISQFLYALRTTHTTHTTRHEMLV